MVSEWREAFLTELYEIRSGLSKPAKDFGTGYPFLAFKDVFNNFFVPESLSQLVQSSEKERENCSVRKGDVFLTRTSETMHELGMSCVALKDYENATFNGFTKRLRPRVGIDVIPEYVGYFLRSPKFRNEMMAFSTMSTRASLNNEMIGRLRLVLPPIPEQKAIAHILKALDGRIDLNRRMNETLEAMAQALFKSWFVDFDPVIDNALASGKEIPGELSEKAHARANLGDKRRPLPEEIRTLFPDEFTYSDEMGWIPKGWEVGALGDYLVVKRGGSPRPIHDYLVPQGLPWVKIADATSSPSRFLTRTKDFIKPEGLNKTVFLKKNSLILSNSATPGLPIFLDLDACIHDGWLYFPETKHFNDFYLYQLFWVIRDELLSMGSGTIFTNLKTDILKNHTVIVPRKDLLLSFKHILTPIFEKLHGITAANNQLAKLRDTLLPKLLSGEIRIPDAEKMVEELTL